MCDCLLCTRQTGPRELANKGQRAATETKTKKSKGDTFQMQHFKKGEKEAV